MNPFSDINPVNRKAPCRCGSGKKAKHCCLKESPPELAPPASLLHKRLNAIHNEMAEKILTHGIRLYGKISIEEAWDDFYLGAAEETFQEMVGNARHKMQCFVPYFLYNWRPGSRQAKIFESSRKNISIAEDFLEKNRRTLPTLTCRYLEAAIKTPFSLFDVIEVKSGESLGLKDVFLGTEIHVLEKLGSENTKVGDIYFVKPVAVDDVTILIGTCWFLIPPAQKVYVLELRKKLQVATQKQGVEITLETLHSFDLEIRDLVLKIEKNLFSPPKLCNTDGDEISIHRITYKVESPQITFDNLKDLALMDDEDEKNILAEAVYTPDGGLEQVELTWLKPSKKANPDAGNTVLGNLMIKGKSLIIEVNSKNRAMKIKKEIERRLKKQATHQSTVLQSPESLRKENVQKPRDIDHEREQEELMNNPEVRERIKKMMQAHWEKWYDEKIPALGNITPLQAAKTAEGRELLTALLLDYERHDAVRKPPYDPNYPQIRKRLGLGS